MKMNVNILFNEDPIRYTTSIILFLSTSTTVVTHNLQTEWINKNAYENMSSLSAPIVSPPSSMLAKFMKWLGL